MQFEGAVPAPCFAVALQLCLQAFKCIKCNVLEQVHTALSFPLLLRPFLDGVYAARYGGPEASCDFARIFQLNGRDAAQADFTAPTVDSVAKHPLASTVLTLDEPQAISVLMFSSQRGFNE